MKKQKNTNGIIIEMPGPPELGEALKTMADMPDEKLPLFKAALYLGALDLRKHKLNSYQDHAEDLIASTHTTSEYLKHGSAQARAEALRAVLFEQFEYCCVTGDLRDPVEANLTEVIDNRAGVPVALGILGMHIAGRMGWQPEGLSFPSQFMFRISGDSGDRVAIDMLSGGRPVTPADMRAMLKVSYGADFELSPNHYAPVRKRDVLLRLQNNLKIRRYEAEQASQALLAIKSMILFDPDNIQLWREAGIMHIETGNIRYAITALEEYLRRATEKDSTKSTRKLLQKLEQTLN